MILVESFHHSSPAEVPGGVDVKRRAARRPTGKEDGKDRPVHCKFDAEDGLVDEAVRTWQHRSWKPQVVSQIYKQTMEDARGFFWAAGDRPAGPGKVRKSCRGPACGAAASTAMGNIVLSDAIQQRTSALTADIVPQVEGELQGAKDVEATTNGGGEHQEMRSCSLYREAGMTSFMPRQPKKH